MSTVYTHQSEYDPGSLIENVCLPGLVPTPANTAAPNMPTCLFLAGTRKYVNKGVWEVHRPRISCEISR